MMQRSLSERLRVLRARRGLSLTEAAERAGVTRDTISDLERGKRRAYMPTLTKIAKGYRVPVEELLEEPVPLDEAPGGAGLMQVDELPGLRLTRERRGFSRDELAFKTGIPMPVLVELEDGRRTPDPGDLEVLAHALDCYKGDLFLPVEVMKVFRANNAQENERLRREAEKLTANDIRALKLASPAFRKLSKALEESTNQEGREVG